jgi:hypothetical protein
MKSTPRHYVLLRECYLTKEQSNIRCDYFYVNKLPSISLGTLGGQQVCLTYEVFMPHLLSCIAIETVDEYILLLPNTLTTLSIYLQFF